MILFILHQIMTGEAHPMKSRHGSAKKLAAPRLRWPVTFAALSSFLVTAAWIFGLGNWDRRTVLPFYWLEPALFGLTAFLLNLCFLVWFRNITMHRNAAYANSLVLDELNSLFSRELPGNRFWVWSWPSGTFEFAEDWLRLAGFASMADVRNFLRNRRRLPADDQAQRPLLVWESLLFPDDVETARAELAAYRQNIHAAEPYAAQYRIIDSQGIYRWVQVTGRAAVAANGEVLGMAAVFQDITAQVTISEELARERTFTEGLINSTDLFVLLLDTHGRILRFNPFAERITGYVQAEVIGRPWIDCLFRESEKADMRRLFERVKINQAVRQKQARLLHKNGQDIELVWHYHPLTDHQGKTSQLAVIGMDVTDRRILEKQLYELAFFDKLTGLSNQARLDQHLQNMIRRRTNRDESLTVVYFDIDHFKHVNDALGYASGDELLQWIAEQLRHLVQEPDIAARLGEDEFVLLLSTYRTERSVSALVHELQRILGQPWQRENHSFEITVSTGVAFYPQHGSDFKTLLQHASIALFDAKDHGRNQVCFYDQKMYLRNLRYIDQVNQLNQAIKQKQFVLHYQLQYDLKTGAARGAEALIRWNHPQRGLIPPQSFIPLAEAAGCINEISRWALEEASRQKRLWNEQGLAIEKVAVNLSSYSFKLQDLTGTIARVLGQSSLPGSEIELEITESALLDNVEGAMDKIHELQKQGITFVLDDFGTGYSSLTYLRQLPVRVIKIDKSFIRTIYENKTDAMIVRAIIDLAHDLELTVVAEGIETREQMKLLQSYNCDYGQGYLFHYPQSADQIVLHELGHPTINAGKPLNQRFL